MAYIKQKGKRGCYCARCLCTRHIKAAVSAAFFIFIPTPARGNANGISEFIKQKENRGCCCVRCLCTRHIKAAVSAAEREIIFKYYFLAISSKSNAGANEVRLMPSLGTRHQVQVHVYQGKKRGGFDVRSLNHTPSKSLRRSSRQV